jgi:hypothetical protein
MKITINNILFFTILLITAQATYPTCTAESNNCDVDTDCMAMDEARRE